MNILAGFEDRKVEIIQAFLDILNIEQYSAATENHKVNIYKQDLNYFREFF